MTTNRIATLFCLCGFATIMTNLRADTWDKKTVFTFSAPVEIPGQVLPAGTYVFKLLNSSSTRNVVQVFNKDENHLIGTFITILDYEMKTPDKPLIRATIYLTNHAFCSILNSWRYLPPSKKQSSTSLMPRSVMTF